MDSNYVFKLEMFGVTLDGYDVVIQGKITDGALLTMNRDLFSGDFVAKNLAPLFRDEYKWRFERLISIAGWQIIGTRSLLVEVVHAPR